MNDLLQWLVSEIKRSSDYHDHKENMAWVSTVFYMSGTLFLARLDIDLIRYGKILVFILIIVLYLLMLGFLSFQFRNRRIAAKRVQNAVDLSLKVLKDNEGALPETQRNVLSELDRQYNVVAAPGPEQTEIISYVAITLAFLASLAVVLFWRAGPS